MTEMPPEPPLVVSNIIGDYSYVWEEETGLLTQYKHDGTLVSETPMTEAEARAAITTAARTITDNKKSVIDYLGTARAENDAYLAKPNADITPLDNTRQVKALTRQNNRIMRLLRNDMTGTD